MPKRFGEWLREERERRGWDKTELAERAGLTQPAITQYETGKRFPKKPTLERLADALGISREEAIHAWSELTYDLDPDAMALLEAYTGLDTDRREDLRELAERWRERDRRRSIGGGVGTDEEGNEDDHDSASDER